MPRHRPEGEHRRRLGPWKLLLFSSVTSALVLLGLADALFQGQMTLLEEELAEARAGRFEAPGSLKLMFLGDSFTNGALSESGLGYPAFLADELRAAGVERPVEVVSVAIEGSTSWYQERQLRLYIEEGGGAPDYAMWIAGENDFLSLQFQSEFARRGGSDVTPWIRAIYRGPRGLIFGMHWYERRYLGLADNDAGTVEASPLLGYWRAHPGYRAWLRQAQVARFADFAQRVRGLGGVPLAGSYVRTRPMPFEGAAGEQGVPFLDSTQLAELHDERSYFIEDRWHLSDAGTRDFAHRWARWFVKVTGEGQGSGYSPAHGREDRTQ